MYVHVCMYLVLELNLSSIWNNVKNETRLLRLVVLAQYRNCRQKERKRDREKGRGIETPLI